LPKTASETYIVDAVRTAGGRRNGKESRASNAGRKDPAGCAQERALPRTELAVIEPVADGLLLKVLACLRQGGLDNRAALNAQRARSS